MNSKIKTVIIIAFISVIVSFWLGVGICHNRMMVRFGNDIERIKADNAYLYRELYRIEAYKIEQVKRLTSSLESRNNEVDRLIGESQKEE